MNDQELKPNTNQLFNDSPPPPSQTSEPNINVSPTEPPSTPTTNPENELVANPSPQSNFPRLLILTLLLIILALSGTTAYLLLNPSPTPQAETTTPTEQTSAEPISESDPDPTANWLVYTNSRYNYEISLPAGWYNFTNTGYESEDSYPPNWLTPIPNPDSPITVDPYAFMVDFQPINNSEEYPNGVITIQYLEELPATDAPMESTTINESSAYRFSFDPLDYHPEDSGINKTEQYLISHPDGGYIDILYRASPDNPNWNTFHQILSTFQFHQDSTSIPSDWESFTHTQLPDSDFFRGFALHHPPEWQINYSRNEATLEIPYSIATITLTASNGDYVELRQSEGGGGRCLYPDMPEYDSFDGYGIKFTNFTEIQNSIYTWRLSPHNDTSISQTESHSLCQFDQNQNIFIDSTILGFDKIKLTTQSNQETLVKILENIQLQ